MSQPTPEENQQPQADLASPSDAERDFLDAVEQSSGPDVPAEEPADPMAAADVVGEQQFDPLKPTPRQFVSGDPSPTEVIATYIPTDVSALAMPTATTNVIADADERIPENVTKKMDWGTVLEASEQTNTNGEGEKALQDPERAWSRAMYDDTIRMGARDMRLPRANNKAVTGQMAVIAYRSTTAGAAGAQTSFWGSGFDAKFLTQDNTQLFDFQYDIASSRISLGRSTFGMALSAHMVYTAQAVLTAARKALTSSSLRPDVDLGDAVRITDFQTLAWSLAHATFSEGFDISRACVASIETCNEVVTQRVLPRRMWLVDDKAISAEQRAWFRGLTDAKLTLDELKKYQNMFPRLRNRVVPVLRDDGSTVEYTLKVPTLNEYISSAMAWVDEINAATVASIGEAATFNERNKMMNSRTKAAAARQYAHWVEAIKLPGHEHAITEPEDIARVLAEATSSNDVDLTNFMTAVREFHESMMTTQIVVPNWKCPACNKYQMYTEGTNPEDEQPPMYTPVEAVNTFFGLALRRLSKVAAR